MSESSTGSAVGGVAGDAARRLEALVEGSFLAKLLATEAALVGAVLALFAIGGDFTSETPSAFGVFGGFLGAIAGLLWMVIVLYTLGLAAVRGYAYLSGA